MKAKITKLVNLKKSFGSGKQHPQYDGSPVELSTVGRLEKVEKRKRQKSNGDIVNCCFSILRTDCLSVKWMRYLTHRLNFWKTKSTAKRGCHNNKPEIFRATPGSEIFTYGIKISQQKTLRKI